MHFIPTSIALLFAASVTATLQIDAVEHGGLAVGKKYPVGWSSDTDLILTLKLVSDAGNGGWEPVENIFTNVDTPAGNNSFAWTVPDVNPELSYALWLNGEYPNHASDDKPTVGEASITPYFHIAGGSLSGGDNFSSGEICAIVFGTLAVFFGIVGAVTWFFISRRRARKATAGEIAMTQQASPPPEYDGVARLSEDSLASEKERVRKMDMKGMDV